MTMHPDRLLLFLILNETALITQRLDSIVSDQDQLNADVAEENTLLTTMEKEIASLQAQPAAVGLDFSGVNSVLSRLKGDAASAAPAPAGTGTPAAPAAPASTGTPAQPTGAAPAAPAGQASGPATGDSIPAPGAAPAEAAPPATPPADAAPAATTPSGLTPPATGDAPRTSVPLDNPA